MQWRRCPNCDGYGYYSQHEASETQTVRAKVVIRGEDNPRFTKDEIAQMRANILRSYQAENDTLQDRVAGLEAQLLQWQELGAQLVDWFKPRYSAETGGLGLMMLGYFPEHHLLHIAFKRLLELTSD